jgi:hypothetical protein
VTLINGHGAGRFIPQPRNDVIGRSPRPAVDAISRAVDWLQTINRLGHGLVRRLDDSGRINGPDSALVLICIFSNFCSNVTSPATEFTSTNSPTIQIRRLATGGQGRPPGNPFHSNSINPKRFKHHQVPPVGLAPGRVPETWNKRETPNSFSISISIDIRHLIWGHFCRAANWPKSSASSGRISFRPSNLRSSPACCCRPIFCPKRRSCQQIKPPNANSKSIKLPKNNFHFQLLANPATLSPTSPTGGT